MNINLIEMPLNLGANHLGVEKGAGNILAGAIMTNLFNAHHVKINKIDCPSYTDINNTNILFKNLSQIFTVNTLLADLVYNSLEQDEFPLVLGGDHALSWGSISGVSKHNPDIGVVYVDAHGDFNLAEMSPSHNVHGMHMAYLMGLSQNKYNDFYFPGIKLDYSKVFFVATRSLDWGEKELASKFNLNINTSQAIKSNGIESVTERLLHQIETSGISKFHLSFDIDAIDPSFAPGTGVPEKDGITKDEAKYLLEHLLNTKKCISMDLVEFNPDLDVENKTFNICMDILSIVNDCLK